MVTAQGYPLNDPANIFYSWLNHNQWSHGSYFCSVNIISTLADTNKWKWNLKRNEEKEYLCSVNTISTLADIQCCKNLQELYIRLVVGTFLLAFICFKCFFFSERTKSLISVRSSGWGICRDWRICKWSIPYIQGPCLYVKRRGQPSWYVIPNTILGASSTQQPVVDITRRITPQQIQVAWREPLRWVCGSRAIQARI